MMGDYERRQVIARDTLEELPDACIDDDYYPDRAAKANKPLTRKGYVGAWSEHRGDWKAIRECLDLQEHYGRARTCHLCRAHKRIKRLLYTRFQRNSRSWK